MEECEGRAGGGSSDGEEEEEEEEEEDEVVLVDASMIPSVTQQSAHAHGDWAGGSAGAEDAASKNSGGSRLFRRFMQELVKDTSNLEMAYRMW